MATLFQLPKAVPVVAGESLPGAKAYFYQAGTTTPITTYTTAALSVAHNHPVVADGNGVFAPIFLNEAVNTTYRLQLYNSIDVLQYDVDNLQTIIDVSRQRTAAEISAGITPTNYSYEPGDVRRYGAVGDGVANDTTAVQNALNSGSDYVFGHGADTYLLSQTGTKTINSVAHRYCVDIPTGVHFDGRGATLKLASSQNAAIIINDGAGVSTDTGIVIENMTLDGNQANQTTPGAGDMPCVFLYNVTGTRVENIKATNVRQYAGRFLNCDKCHFDWLYCTDSDGDGWSFGTTTAGIEFRVFRSFIDNIYAESCTANYGSLNGNGIVLTVVQCSIGRLVQKDCGGGIKVQNSSQDTSIGSMESYGLVNGSVNCGVKIQGDNAAGLYPVGISVGRIVAEGNYGRGLSITNVGSVTIGEYIGRNNGGGGGATGSDQYDADIELNNGTAPRTVIIGSMFVENNAATTAVRLNTGNGRVHIGRCFIYNAAGVAFQSQISDYLEIGDLEVIDDQGSPTTTVAFNKTAACHGKIGCIKTNLTHSITSARVQGVAADYNFEIGRIQLGSSDVLDGVQQLTNAATSTSVTCGHIWRAYVGGTSDYLHPIIQVAPLDTSARALSGSIAVSAVTDGSSGTGFTIGHPTAGAADYVVWRVLGWKILSQAAS